MYHIPPAFYYTLYYYCGILHCKIHPSRNWCNMYQNLLGSINSCTSQELVKTVPWLRNHCQAIPARHNLFTSTANNSGAPQSIHIHTPHLYDAERDANIWPVSIHTTITDCLLMHNPSCNVVPCRQKHGKAATVELWQSNQGTLQTIKPIHSSVALQLTTVWHHIISPTASIVLSSNDQPSKIYTYSNIIL